VRVVCTRVLATAVLLAATVFLLRLEGQIRATQRPAAPARASVGSPFHSRHLHPNGFGVSSGVRFTRRSVFGGRVGFRNRGSFHLFFEHAFFSDPFVAPFLCRHFLFGNRSFFPQPFFLPYPVYTSPPYYQVAEQNPGPAVDPKTDLATEVNRL